MTNKPLKGKINENIKNKILKLFLKNKQLEEDINNIKKNLDLQDDYSIIHFRLGDNQLVRNHNSYDNFEKYYDKYLLHKQDNQLLISDNILFHKYLLKKIRILKYLIQRISII